MRARHRNGGCGAARPARPVPRRRTARPGLDHSLPLARPAAPKNPATHARRTIRPPTPCADAREARRSTAPRSSSPTHPRTRASLPRIGRCALPPRGEVGPIFSATAASSRQARPARATPRQCGALRAPSAPKALALRRWNPPPGVAGCTDEMKRLRGTRVDESAMRARWLRAQGPRSSCPLTRIGGVRVGAQRTPRQRPACSAVPVRFSGSEAAAAPGSLAPPPWTPSCASAPSSPSRPSQST